MPDIALFATALALVIVLAIITVDVRSFLDGLPAQRRLIGHFPPRWRQLVWAGLLVPQMVSIIFWLLIAFPTACQLARLAMSPA
ncbi:hypothetical protein [Sphingobium yanoikuyae]|uniref:hypothetical protein n=1 Tax=Sphingobium yanoikuyae TaxID=13690 RepID=UPI00345EE4DC